MKSKFNRYESVLTEGFTDRDATPPSNTSVASKTKRIGVYNLSDMVKKGIDNDVKKEA